MFHDCHDNGLSLFFKNKNSAICNKLWMSSNLADMFLGIYKMDSESIHL